MGGALARDHGICFRHPSSTLSHTLTFRVPLFSPEGAAAVDHVQIVPKGDGRTAVPLPRDCRQTVGTGGFAGSPFFLRFYIDDGGLIEGRVFPEGRRCVRAVQSIASDHFGQVRCRPAVGCCWQPTVGRVSRRGREPGQEGSVGA